MRFSQPFLYLLFSIATVSLQAIPLSWNRTSATVELAPQVTQAQASYIATNSSNKIVQISKIETSCGCTGSIINKKQLRPGESTEVLASFKKGQRKSGGSNTLNVFLVGEDHPSSRLELKVKIATPLRAKPEIVFWRADSAPTARQVQITLDSRYVTQLDSIVYDKEKMNVVPIKESPTQLTLSILPQSFDDAMQQTIKVRSVPTKQQNSSEVKIHVFVQP
jgi:hypothetical protein